MCCHHMRSFMPTRLHVPSSSALLICTGALQSATYLLPVPPPAPHLPSVMALLFEKSVSWRRLVAATRNPRVMAAFTAASVAAAAGVAVATQSVTDATGGAASTAAASATVARDWEAARYAAHSKRALGVLFDDVRGRGEAASAGSRSGAASAGPSDGDGGGGHADGGGGGGRAPAAIDYRAIKLPGVAWHPAVAAKEKAAKEKAAKEAAAKAAAAKELAAKEVAGSRSADATAESSAAAVITSPAQGQTTPAAAVAPVGSPAVAAK